MNDQATEMARGAKIIVAANGDPLPVCFFYFDSYALPDEPHEDEDMYAYALMRQPTSEGELLTHFTELASVVRVAPRVCNLVVVMDIAYRTDSPFFEMIPSTQPDYAMGLIFQSVRKDDSEQWLLPYHIDDDGQIVYDEVLSLDEYVPETNTAETLGAMTDLIQAVWTDDVHPFPLDQIELFHVLAENGHTIERRPIEGPCSSCGGTH